MNFAQLRAEVKTLGLADASDTELGNWVNRAIREIENRSPWPWREKVVTTTPPLPAEIADLQHVRKVVCGDTVLAYMDRRLVLDRDPELDDEGEPLGWYQLDGKIYTWPETGKALTVTYLAKPKQLVNVSDTPDIPEEFHELIVSGARIRGYLKAQAYAAADAERTVWQDWFAEMVRAHRRPNHDSDGHMRLTGLAADYVS